MNHRVARPVFVTIVSIGVAYFSYLWITDPTSREERSAQEKTVVVARTHLLAVMGQSGLEVVDPLAPNRKAGKVYVYRVNSGWEVSGYYRRNETDRWHPWLMQLDGELEMLTLKSKDAEPELLKRASGNALLDISP